MNPHARRPVKPPHPLSERGRRRPAVALLAVLLVIAVVAPLVAMLVPSRASAEVAAVSASPTPTPSGEPSAPAAAASSRALATNRMPVERGRIATARLRHLPVDGLDRDYLVQPAPGARGAGRLPVVVLLHGGTQTAQDVWRESSLPTVGAREGFLVVAPQAIGRRWNDARGLGLAGDPPSTADDVRFLRAVIADVIAQDHGDPSAVFMVGVSNGGFMAMRFACDAGETLRAGASVISALPDALARSCKSPRPLPWLAVVGRDDPLIPFAGQPEGALRRGEAQPALRSADDTFRFWADRAGCAAASAREPLTDAALDDRHRWAERVRRSGCVGGNVSDLVVLHGSGHVVPGLPAEGRLIERVAGPAAPELDDGTLVWAHFRETLLK